MEEFFLETKKFELQLILKTTGLDGIMRLLSFETDFNKLIVFYFKMPLLILFLKTYVYIRKKNTYICSYESVFW